MVVQGGIGEYDFRTHQNVSVLDGDDVTEYRLAGVLRDQAMLVISAHVGVPPRYVLERRDLDGSHPRPLFTSVREIAFYGWVE